MKASSMLFAALLVLGINSYGIYLPGNGKTPIFFCHTEDLHARVSKDSAAGTAFLSVERIQANNDSEVVLEQQVTELSNKSHTIYTGDKLMLKIQHHPSGTMPGVMFVSQEETSEEIKMNCQIVYSIM